MSEISGIGLKGETEFLRRQHSRLLSRQKKIRTIKVRGLHLLLVFIVFLLAGFAAFKAGKFIMTWEQLRVSSFKLINSPAVGPGELKRVLQKYHVNILSLNLGDLREELLQIKEVKDVSLSRKLPAAVEVRFILRTPVFQLVREEKGRQTYDVIDREGVVLSAAKKQRSDLITIKGVANRDLARIMPHLAELKRIKRTIDWISLREPYGIALKLKGFNEIFYPGEDDYAHKIDYYLELRPRFLSQGNEIRYVDLRFENRFYLEYAEEVRS